MSNIRQEALVEIGVNPLWTEYTHTPLPLKTLLLECTRNRLMLLATMEPSVSVYVKGLKECRSVERVTL